MNYRNIKNISYSASLLFHSILLVIFLLVNLTFEFPAKDYVELSFGISAETGSSGAIGEKLDKIQELAKPEEQNITENKNPEVKEVKLPVAKNTQDENVIKPAEKDKEQKKETKTETKTETKSDVSTTGQGNLAQGEGSFGFDLE
jgi:outer membrane biosynthesis protein TonB